jgi:CheY-like chemotaxis protein
MTRPLGVTLVRHVLVVDDNRDLADSVALLLADEGFEARVAYSAEEAWAEARRAPPEVVILDIRMPGVGGLELARALRAAAQLPLLLIAFTGSMLAAEHAALRGEFDAVVRKPATLDDILVAMQAVASKTATPHALGPR